MSVSEKATIFTKAQHGDLDQFKSDFNLDEINTKSDIGSGLLHHAIAGRNFEIAMYLIENNINVNLTNLDGQTALHYISNFPSITIAKEILNAGGDINIRDKFGNNALWTAVFNCKGKYYEMVELFMTKNPDVTSKNKAGRSPLDFAIQVENQKLIDILSLQ
ncbi:ankyrin repeat domain-containing protein [Paenibacillus koleovorans]|uniref:ankyrin repeat domain-containing protein n=1 Tax=Paenibacillus koleovorans TaxID=121608 RepID=UPI000FDA0B0E|nr:ankyrin repeat domain-containing protein [Paenibacillus koleovorans]